MENYRHHVSGFFATSAVAERARATLAAEGFPSDQIAIYRTKADSPAASPRSESKEVLKNVVVDGVVGTAVGVGIGALAEVALAAASVSLFVASPLIGPLAMLGWGAGLGGLVGAAVGTVGESGGKTGPLSALIGDALISGQVVLVAETRTPDQTTLARRILGDATGPRGGGESI